MAEVIQKKRFTETQAYLNNPHRGCCTFQHFNGDPLFEGVSWSEAGPLEFPAPKKQVIDGYLPCSVSYCRWFWDVLEPEDGVYDFSMITKSLQICQERGQSLTIRLMPYGAKKHALTPSWYEGSYPVDILHHKGKELTILDPESSEYLEKWGNLIRAVAKEFDAHPLFEAIDLAFIGPWGEGAASSSDAQVERFVDMYAAAFKETRLISQLTNQTFQHARKHNAGWRVDCFGDLKEHGSPTFPKDLSGSHMFDSYPKSLCELNAQDNWKTAPVFMETCGVPMGWYYGGYAYDHVEQSFDIDFIIEQGYKYHTTYFMPKSTRLPDTWMDKLKTFSDKIGYRYVYRQAILDLEAKIGSTFNFSSWIENTGVAPIYVKYDLAVRMRQGDSEEIVTLDHIDICNWLPGDVWLDENISIPTTFRTGPVEISVGIVDNTKKSRVHFAVNERFSDGWVGIGTLFVS